MRSDRFFALTPELSAQCVRICETSELSMRRRDCEQSSSCLAACPGNWPSANAWVAFLKNLYELANALPSVEVLGRSNTLSCPVVLPDVDALLGGAVAAADAGAPVEVPVLLTETDPCSNSHEWNLHPCMHKEWLSSIEST